MTLGSCSDGPVAIQAARRRTSAERAGDITSTPISAMTVLFCPFVRQESEKRLPSSCS